MIDTFITSEAPCGGHQRLVLAYILEVPPLLLFAPADGDEKLQIAPGVEKDAIEAAAWVADDAAMMHRVILPEGMHADNLRTNYVKYPQETTPLTLLRYIAEIIRMIKADEEWLARWRASPRMQERWPDEDRYGSWFPRYGERLAQLFGWLEGLGYAVPELPAEVAAIMEREGVPDWRQLALERPAMLEIPVYPGDPAWREEVVSDGKDS